MPPSWTGTPWRPCVTTTSTHPLLLTQDRITTLFDTLLGVELPPPPAPPPIARTLDELAAIADQIDRFDRDQQARVDLAEHVYRDLPMVRAEPEHAPGHGYLSREQWLLHVQVRKAASVDVLAKHRVSDRAVTITARTLAGLARRNGVFLAGVENAAEIAPGISERTFYRCLDALTDLGVLTRTFAGRLVTYVERAIILATGRSHRRWRSIWQLTMPRRVIRPSSWQSPRTGLLQARHFRYICFSTATSAVDKAATRPSHPGAVSGPGRRAGRWLDARAVVLFGELQRQSATWRRAHLGRMYPHLLKYALAGASAAGLIMAIDDEHLRAGRPTPRHVRDADRWLISCLGRITVDDLPAR